MNWLFSGLMIVFLPGCFLEENKKSVPGNQSSSSDRALFFTAVDPLSQTRSASVYRFIPGESQESLIASGEGSDPLFFALGEKLVLFNRSLGQQSARVLIGASDGRVNSTQQLRIGDPHDALLLKNGKVLLALYNEGMLAIWDPQTQTIQKLDQYQWDLPANISLHPVQLLRMTSVFGDVVMVLHQSFDFRDGKFISNDSQRFFVFTENEEGVLTPLDLDRSTPAITGKALKGSFPQAWNVSSRKLITLAMCSRFLAEGSPCNSVVETIDDHFEVKELWNLSASPWMMNGLAEFDPSSMKIFANVETLDAAKSQYEPHTIELNVELKEIRDLYQHNPKFGGAWSLVLDHVKQELYIGDVSEDRKGLYSVFNLSTYERVNQLKLDLVPYSAKFFGPSGNQ